MTDREALKEAVPQPQAGTGDALRMAREALEPFARAAGKLDSKWSEDDWRWNDSVRSNVTVRDIRRASKALAALSAGTVEPEPVAWRWRWNAENAPIPGKAGRWNYTENGECGDERLKDIEPLYAALSSPQPSVGRDCDTGHGSLYDRLLTFLHDRDSAIAGDPPCAVELDESVKALLSLLTPAATDGVDAE